ncbi:3-hydroxyacyl-CoA dehyrogenase [Sporothrix brasiliensis 5110]|uniref:3-hydroxyacyl-CoA dehyrogenase n=1 Tax=Sporothrix brasiliensis 5110 TaxID=1398154 RepID=A0A0C2IPR2_9PEZI|nr:3-hydroxyacyl-CoA dehyrogenase [Sporothrix brasiliensis 5110]KIH87057.1 3-hydroxyacyl-CoA dehyrogenase [Sporothrix brasiliensis 5110]
MASSRGVTLIGAGTQGTRLAYMVFHVVDKSRDQLDRSAKEIRRLRKEWPLPSLPGRRGGNTDWGEASFSSPDNLETAIHQSWLAIECVPESKPLMKALLQQLDGIAPPDVIVASNSSSYTISELLEGLALKAPDRFASIHSYWPPETTPVEIMGTDTTRPGIVDVLMQESAAHGFQPFHVRRSSTGYIYNRIWAAIKRETLLALDEQVATPSEIDALFKAVLKTPKGPCEQMDTVGLDVVLAIEEHYAEERQLPDAPRTFLKNMIAEGKLGVKSGEGFFNYEKK